MTRVRRLPLGLLVPALLVALVAVLATLQYRWLGKVSEAEREQLRRTLDQRAREFVDEFDGEIGRVYLALTLSKGEVDREDWDRFAAAVDRWRDGARFPAMVREFLLVQASGEAPSVRRYDQAARAFGKPSTAWPAELGKLRAHLPPPAPAWQPTTGVERPIVSFTLTPVAPDVPALLVPVGAGPLPVGPEPQAEGGAGDVPVRRRTMTARLWFQWPATFVVAMLDEEVIARTVLPALAARHLPEGAGSYRVAVLSGTGERLFSRGLASGASLDPARADSVTPFFNLRLDVLRAVDPAAFDVALPRKVRVPDLAKAPPGASQQMAIVVEHRDGGAPGEPVQGARRVRPSWRLVLQHPAGSLDAAVSQARRRNLWLGSGILAVLLAGVALVVVNARRASQLAARQMDFVTTVSHELRTPLAVIRSAAQNLAAGVIGEPAQTRRYGELIEAEGRRLTEMVEQILEYSRVHGGPGLRDRSPLDVALLLEDLHSSCAPLCAQAGVTLAIEVPPDIPPILGDEAAVRRALANLVTNAVKHAPDGRWVGVTAAVALRRGRPFVEIAVSDRGPGIPHAELPHVFEPFYRGRRAVERQAQGNGLGLSLVERVAQAHGGSVGVASTPGQGSTFTLRLPAAPSSAAPVAAGAGEGSRVTGA